MRGIAFVDRPREIGRFEALALLGCLVDVIATLAVVHLAAKGVLSAIVGSAIALALILWVSRGRGLVGRIMLTIWLALGLIADIAGYALLLMGGHFGNTNPLLLALSLAGFGLNCAALYFAWAPASTAWLRTKPS
jgi:hypothetical protein